MPAKRGRPSKGARRPVTVQQPVELRQAAAVRATERGLTMTDYVNLLVAQDLGLPYGEQEGLNLGISA